ncbi:SulP family inorganic anion transporter [Mucilaginibacter sp. 14171R-50]|uniref:SulP family inorganic anion transporter n=1 Tax=Mucilaginibacter sp. 14171R-50 TaxID=2703789 RepID=UPI00138D3CD0|nr:SulP family inorganic anion transporter [Mucilaginibacter sp. 14171R-50]QHS54112.1 SulP family inorganic anion transporter [Mucilaginibacter sp. 14171R-50]
MQIKQGGVTAGDLNLKKYFLAKNLKKDIPSGLVVFLVALPLCLGIALASGAPLFSGILSGIIGGIVIGALSGSQLSVAGPAAGLTVIVLNSIATLGSFEAFLLAVLLAGAMQILLGLVKAGTIANYFPSAVIEGMLAAIGIILIMKQFPHAVGYDSDFEGDEGFSQADSNNTFSGIISAVSKINYGAVIIAGVSLLLMIYWPKFKKVAIVPAPLMVVVIGVVLASLFSGTSLALLDKQFVQIPVVNSTSEFFGLFKSPNFSGIGNKQVWITAATIAIVASLETLLSLEAVDKIDPIKRVSPTNRELIAQGAGNVVSGLLGGLPMTAVIVRSSANVNSGARTKVSAIFHGFLLLICLLTIPSLLNKIPLSCLAAILLTVGYKLARIGLFKHMWHKGLNQFIPFVVTIVAVIFTDLLIGVGIGMLVGVFYILRTNLRNPYFYTIAPNGEKNTIRIKLAEEVSFLNKAAIQVTLTSLPKGSDVVIDGSQSRYIDPDVLEIIHNYKHNAYTKGIVVQLQDVKERYDVPPLKELVYKP